MKKLLKPVALLLSGILFLSSCAEEDETPQDFREEYLGVWDVTEKTGINAPQIYSVQISEGSTADEVVIHGFYNIPAVSVRANIDEFDLNIPQQSSENIAFSGNGSANVDFDQLSVNFTANDGSGPDQVKAVFTR